jgi:hypothetical protein
MKVSSKCKRRKKPALTIMHKLAIKPRRANLFPSFFFFVISKDEFFMLVFFCHVVCCSEE